MTLTIALQLTPEMEARLQEGIAQRDAAAVREVLIAAVEPAVEDLLVGPPNPLSVEEAERLLDRLVADVRSQLPDDWRGLSDYAVSRDSIYEDHP